MKVKRDSMGLKVIAWVGSTYMKFEDACLERQATIAKYVEKQVKTMCASIKRFCCDASYDLLIPPSSSSQQLREVSTADDVLQNPCIQYIKPVEDDAINTDNCEMVRCDNFEVAMEDSTSISGQMVERRSRCISSSNIIIPGSSIVNNNPEVKDETGSNSKMHMIGHDEFEFKSGFEETCVLVDGNDYVHYNHTQAIRPSYKRKIQEAFSLRKISERNKEYKQVGGKVTREHKVKCDEEKTSFDSEWEIL